MMTRNLCKCCLAGALVSVGAFGLRLDGAETGMANGAAPARPATPEKKIVVKSPGEVATQVATLLQSGKAPWQTYRSYITMFQQFAERQGRVPAATREAQVLRARMVAHYQGMANVLEQMQQCAAVRDGIKQNRTEIPFGERQARFAEAGRQRDELLQQFVLMGSKLTGFRMPPAQPSRVASSPAVTVPGK